MRAWNGKARRHRKFADSTATWLITFLKPETWLRFAIWFVLGMIVYFAYSRRHSQLNRAIES